LGDTKCPICKAPNEQIIVDADLDPTIDEHKKFEQYERWGDELGSGYIYRDDVGMFFQSSYFYKNVLPLFSLACNMMGCLFDNGEGTGASGTLGALKKHLKTHSPVLSLCDLCIEYKRNFISQLPRYTAQQLKDHNKFGDMPLSGKKRKGASAKGHPMCEFCRPRRFYDLTALHEHLNKDHYKCHICEKLDKPNQFFKDYSALQKHFDREHFLCHHPNCLAARFVVFSNELDLRAHERSVHGISQSGSTKIQMEFRVRPSGRDGSGMNAPSQRVPDLEEDFGFGLDGEAFVPEGLDDGGETDDNGIGDDSLKQEQEPEITHGPHAQRTAFLREQARIRRAEMGIEESQQAAMEAFPALGSENASGGNLVSWSSSQNARAAIRGKKTTSLTAENFPTLGGNKKTSAIGSKLKATKGRSSNTIASFSAISLAANGGSSSHGRATRPAGATTMTSGNFLTPTTSSTVTSRFHAKENLSADNFPSLAGGSSSNGTSVPRYTAANSFAASRRNQQSTNISDMNTHFPSMSTSSHINDRKPAASSVKRNVFRAKPPSNEMLNNVLAFPPPNNNASDGKNAIQAMKLTLGSQKYKTLKGYTKQFASNSLDPETYVTSCASLFENGIQNHSFWEFIPDLIATCPNESRTKRAGRYLENLRLSGLNYEEENDSSTVVASASSNINTVSYVASMPATSSVPRYSAATAFAANASSSVTNASSLLTSSSGRNTVSIPLARKKAAWGGNSKGIVTKAIGGSAVAAAAREQPQNGNATKFMAKEKTEERKMKQHASEKAQGGANDKKKKSKVKKNELRNLAFGGNI
jgi:hypothetical protein